jgi:hypothetical protein
MKGKDNEKKWRQKFWKKDLKERLKCYAEKCLSVGPT